MIMLEISELSAQGIKNTSPLSLICCFSPHHIKPFITIATFPSSSSSSSSSSWSSIKGGNACHVYTTGVYEEGGPNPTWQDKLHLPLDPTFVGPNSCIYLQLYTMRALLGPALLGWVQIPASDILDGLSPIGSTHHLSYRLREKDGSRGHGAINVALKFVGEVPVPGCLARVDTWRTSIGIPVSTWPITCPRDRIQMDKNIRKPMLIEM